jgi:hypothetical protein
MPRLSAFAPGTQHPVMVLRVGSGRAGAAELVRGIAQPLFLDLYSTTARTDATRAVPLHTTPLSATGSRPCTMPADGYTPHSGVVSHGFDAEGRAARSEDGVMVHVPCYAVTAGASVTILSPRSIATLYMSGSTVVVAPVVGGADDPESRVRSVSSVTSHRSGGALYVGGESYSVGSGVRYMTWAMDSSAESLALSTGGGSLLVGAVRTVATLGGALLLSEASFADGVSRMFRCTSESSALPTPGTAVDSCRQLLGLDVQLDPSQEGEPGGEPAVRLR